MNYLILLAGVLATLAIIGHFTMGTKDFLKPVMNSDIDEIPKKVMQSLFHYMSVFMILTSLILLGISTGDCMLFENTTDVLRFIGLIYAAFAFVQFLIALTSSVKMGVFKMFQWILWTLIAFLIFAGIYL